MEAYNVLVLMEKDLETGFLLNTIDSYTIGDNMALVEGIYLMSEEGNDYIYLTLTTEEVEDWQYNGIYELYDETIFDSHAVEVLDGSGEYNPRWILKMLYTPERQEMEKRLNQLIAVHGEELNRVLPLVDSDKEKYIKELED